MEKELKVIKKENIFTKIKKKIMQILKNKNLQEGSQEITKSQVPPVHEQRRIVICGEPHSGKSVLYRTLYKVLPEQYMVNISACPDAESIFSGNIDQETIKLARIKGEFTPEYVSDRKREIEQIDTSILFCDIGGKVTEENREICSKCNTAIILYKTQEALEKWRKFCIETGLEIIGELKSEINIAKDQSEISSESSDKIIRGTIYNLKIGTEQSKSQDKIIETLCSEICRPLIEKGNMRKTGSKVLSEENNIVDMKKVAEHLNAIDDNGNIVWRYEDAKRISDIVSGFVYSKKEVVFYDARATWLATLAVDTAQKGNVEDIALYDARNNQTVKIKKLKVDEKMKAHEINEVERFELLKDRIYLYRKQTDTECVIDVLTNPPDYKISIEDIYSIKLPKISENKELYIMGKIPLWLLTSISRSYENSEKYCCQMGKGGQFYTKISSKDRDNLGRTKSSMDTMNIKEFLTDITDDMKKIAEISKNRETDVPR